MGTFAVALVLFLLIASIIYYMAKEKRKGNSIHCGSSCKDCGGHCHIK